MSVPSDTFKSPLSSPSVKKQRSSQRYQRGNMSMFMRNSERKETIEKYEKVVAEATKDIDILRKARQDTILNLQAATNARDQSGEDILAESLAELEIKLANSIERRGKAKAAVEQMRKDEQVIHDAKAAVTISKEVGICYFYS